MSPLSRARRSLMWRPRSSLLWVQNPTRELSAPSVTPEAAPLNYACPPKIELWTEVDNPQKVRRRFGRTRCDTSRTNPITCMVFHWSALGSFKTLMGLCFLLFDRGQNHTSSS